MAQVPEDMLREKQAEALVEFTLIGTLLGGPAACGCAIAGGLAGVIASRLLGTPDDISWALGGTVATALAAVLPVRLLSPAHRTVVGTVLWVAVAMAAAGALNWYIGSRYEWLIFRWALCGLLIGAFLAPTHTPSAIFAEGDLTFMKGGYGEVALALASFAALVIRMVNRGLPGVLFAGALGGLFGAVGPAAIGVWVGGKQLEELFGSMFVVPISILVLCTAGGVLGGWHMWQQSQRSLPSVEASPS
jgi:hypothetical protein